jgi:hypothetical protein
VLEVLEVLEVLDEVPVVEPRNRFYYTVTKACECPQKIMHMDWTRTMIPSSLLDICCDQPISIPM